MAVAFSFGKQGGFMNNFFATPEGAWGDGSVHLTITGIVIVVVSSHYCSSSQLLCVRRMQAARQH